MRGMAAEFKNHVKGTELQSTYDLLSTVGAKDDLEDLLQVANEISRFTGSPLKKLSEAAVAPREGKALGEFRRRLRTEIRSVETFRSDLIRWISHRCLTFDRERADFLFGAFVDRIATRGIRVFTTNYDAVLEEVAIRREIEISDNFISDGYGRLFWDDTLRGYEREGLRIVNMHGSVQWHASTDGRVEKIPQPADVNRERQELEQLLIFPTRFKDIYRRQFFPLYTHFTRALLEAKVLLVLGHSLRDEYLLAAVRERLRSGGFSVVLVDPLFSAETDLRNSMSDEQWNVFHLKKPLEEARPIVNQFIAEKSPTRAVETVAEAVDLLRRGRKDKIEMKDGDLWVRPGDTCTLTLNADTVIAGGTVRLWIDVGRNPKKRKDVSLSLEGIDDTWAIDGVIRESRKAEWLVPPDLSTGSHQLTAVIQNANNFVIARDERTIKVRKD